MPVYQYVCQAHPNEIHFEQTLSMAEVSTAQPRCPVCEGLAERKFSKPAVQFVGSGFTTKKTYDHPEGSLKKARQMWESS